MNAIPIIGVLMILVGIVIPFAFKKEDGSNPASVGCIGMLLIFSGILIGAPIIESMFSIANMVIVYGGIVIVIIFIIMKLLKK